MALDHGVLNTPLHKRGDIDAQIDRYKAETRRAEAVAYKERMAAKREKTAQAKALIADLADQRAAELMAKFSMTRKQLDEKLNSIAYYTPDVILRGI